MTTIEKQKIADLLDITQDYYSSGYKSEKREYHFEVDAVSVKTESIDTEIESIEKIAGEIRACYNCGLGKTRTNAAPGEGVLQPLVLVIGEGPGADEDAQ
jgi:DNA polymerase